MLETKIWTWIDGVSSVSVTKISEDDAKKVPGARHFENEKRVWDVNDDGVWKYYPNPDRKIRVRGRKKARSQ
jgi:hypothetical protein